MDMVDSRADTTISRKKLSQKPAVSTLSAACAFPAALAGGNNELSDRRRRDRE
jgi:hypothetical protein